MLTNELLLLSLVGLAFAIVCHGHSRRLLRASITSAFLAGLAASLMKNPNSPEMGLPGFFLLFAFFPYFALSLIVGLIYALIGRIASARSVWHVDRTPAVSNKFPRLWKTLFWIVFFILATGVIEGAGFGSFSRIWDWLDVLFTTCAIVGFFLYAYGQRWGPVVFWKVFAVFFIGWDFLINLAIRGIKEPIWPMLAILFPIYLGLILYAFRSYPNKPEHFVLASGKSVSKPEGEGDRPIY